MKPTKRIVTLKVDAWLARYINSVSKVKGVLDVSSDMKLTKCTDQRAFNYLSRKNRSSDSEYIDVLIYRPTLQRVYGALLTQIQAMQKKLLAQALIDGMANLSVYHSLDTTLSDWGIPEAFYSRDRAYKKWQRSKEYHFYRKWCHNENIKNNGDLVILN